MIPKNLWGRLEESRIKKGKEEYLDLFQNMFSNILHRRIEIKEGVVEKDFYNLVIEKWPDCFFINIVPKELYELFREFKVKMPYTITGFTVLCRKSEGRDIRLSCFGVDCGSLGKSLFKK